jgi:hypothetical protein
MQETNVNFRSAGQMINSRHAILILYVSSSDYHNYNYRQLSSSPLLLETSHFTAGYLWLVHFPYLRGCIQKFPDWVDNEIYAYNNKHSLRSNTKGYGDKTH